MIIKILKEILQAIEDGNEAPTIDILETVYLALEAYKEPNYLDVRSA